LAAINSKEKRKIRMLFGKKKHVFTRTTDEKKKNENRESRRS